MDIHLTQQVRLQVYLVENTLTSATVSYKKAEKILIISRPKEVFLYQSLP